MDRRQFLCATTLTGTTLLAGCGGSTDTQTPATNDGTPADSTETNSDGTGGSTTGSFRLLISDQPAAIDDFDSLDVTFDSARVHRRHTGDEQPASETETPETTETEQTATESPTATAANTGTESQTETSATAEGGDSETDSERAFTVFDLDEPTVDLTQVVGDRAIGVLDGKLEIGQYSKIELYVSGTEGIVDGESVSVKVPSNKLQITKSFEITADGTVDFIFDINVVEKGQGGYNLLPVISKSGVAGKDVDVEEVDADDKQPTESGTETTGSGPETTESATETTESGPETTGNDTETTESGTETTATDA